VQPVIRAFVLALSTPDDDGSPRPPLRLAFRITKEAISCAWCDEIGGDEEGAFGKETASELHFLALS